MRIAAKYSHINAEEHLIIRKPEIWCEVCDAIGSVEAEGRERKDAKGIADSAWTPNSLADMNRALEIELDARGWSESRIWCEFVQDEKVLRHIGRERGESEEGVIREDGYQIQVSYNQSDYFKQRVAVGLHMGKCPVYPREFFAKSLGLFVSGVIDVGIEIFPLRISDSRVGSRAADFEQGSLILKKLGRGHPAVPLLLIGVEF